MQVRAFERYISLTPLYANRNKSRLLFSSAEMFNKPLRQTVWTQIRLFWVQLFRSIPNWSVTLGNYLQQMPLEDDIFRCIFFLALLRVNMFWSRFSGDKTFKNLNPNHLISKLAQHNAAF